MKNNEIEKNFKEKLESYGSFDGDKMAMWENIEQELDEKKNRKFIWFWLFPILLGMIGGAWFVFGKNQTAISQTETKEKQDIYETSLSDSKSVGEVKNNTITKKENKQVQSVLENKSIQKEKNTTRGAFNKSNENYTSKLKLFRNTTSANSDISKAREQNLTSPIKLNEPKQEMEKMPTLNKESSILFLPSLNLPFLNVVENVPVIDTVMIAKVPTLSKESPWSIKIGGGLASMNTGFNKTSTNGGIHAATQSAQLGWNFLFEFERIFNNDLYLTSGVHFNRNWLRFNYNETTNSQVQLNDVVIRYDINLLSGDTTFVSGDTSVNKISTRNIQHHNQYDKLKIPILIGKKWTDNRFSYGGAAGVGLDFWLKQSGRYLSEDEFGMYDSNVEGSTLPKMGYSMEFRGEFSFELRKKVHLFAQPYLSVALKNWSIIGDGAVQKPTVFGTNIGLQIKF